MTALRIWSRASGELGVLSSAMSRNVLGVGRARRCAFALLSCHLLYCIFDWFALNTPTKVQRLVALELHVLKMWQARCRRTKICSQ